MTIKTLSVAAAILSVLAGCRNTQEKKMVAIPPVVDHVARPEPAQKPYYYGLIEEYGRVLAEDPNNLAVIIALGNAYSESGAWKEAIRRYEHALRIDPRNVDVRTDMGTAYRNIGMSERALAEYRLVLADEPGHLNARYHMGVVYAYDMHDYAVAVHVWEELLRLAPNYPDARNMRNSIVTFRKTDRKRHH